MVIGNGKMRPADEMRLLMASAPLGRERYLWEFGRAMAAEVAAMGADELAAFVALSLIHI